MSRYDGKSALYSDFRWVGAGSWSRAAVMAAIMASRVVLTIAICCSSIATARHIYVVASVGGGLGMSAADASGSYEIEFADGGKPIF